MLRRTSLVVLLAASGALWAGASQAQDVGIGFYSGYGPDSYDRTYYYGPPAYYYGPPPAYRYAPPVTVQTVRPSRGCGEFHYWTGTRCADARVTPPALD
jgi:hypothetical protein